MLPPFPTTSLDSLALAGLPASAYALRIATNLSAVTLDCTQPPYATTLDPEAGDTFFIAGNDASTATITLPSPSSCGLIRIIPLSSTGSLVCGPGAADLASDFLWPLDPAHVDLASQTAQDTGAAGLQLTLALNGGWTASSDSTGIAGFPGSSGVPATGSNSAFPVSDLTFAVTVQALAGNTNAIQLFYSNLGFATGADGALVLYTIPEGGLLISSGRNICDGLRHRLLFTLASDSTATLAIDGQIIASAPYAGVIDQSGIVVGYLGLLMGAIYLADISLYCHVLDAAGIAQDLLASGLARTPISGSSTVSIPQFAVAEFIPDPARNSFYGP